MCARLEEMPRRHATDETRERLLDVAEDLLARRGYGGTSLGDVAEAAGVVKGTLTYHFSTKHDLVRAVAERVLRRERDETLAVIARHESARDQLAAVIVWTLSGQRRAQHARMLKLRDAARFLPPDVALELYRTYIVADDDPLRGVLERGVENGEFEPHDTAVATRALLGLLSELASDDVDPGRAAAEAVRLVSRGVLKLDAG